jgi:hypothetical protein
MAATATLGLIGCIGPNVSGTVEKNLALDINDNGGRKRRNHMIGRRQPCKKKNA